MKSGTPWEQRLANKALRQNECGEESKKAASEYSGAAFSFAELQQGLDGLGNRVGVNLGGVEQFGGLAGDGPSAQTHRNLERLIHLQHSRAAQATVVAEKTRFV